MEPNEIHFEIARQVIAFRDQVGASSEWQRVSGVIIWVELAPNPDDAQEIDFNILVRPADSLSRRKAMEPDALPNVVVIAESSEAQSVHLVATLLATLYFNGDDIPGLLFENTGFVSQRARKARRSSSEPPDQEDEEPPPPPTNTNFSAN